MIKSAKSCHTAGYDRIDDAVKRQQSAYIFDTEIKMKKITKRPLKKAFKIFLVRHNQTDYQKYDIKKQLHKGHCVFYFKQLYFSR